MNHLIIILEISVLNNTLGFIIKLHDRAFLFSKIYFMHIVLFAFTFLYVSYIFSLEFEKKERKYQSHSKHHYIIQNIRGLQVP